MHSESIHPNVAPVFSIHLNVFNREIQVRTTLVQLLKLTRDPWELIVGVDGATDKSLAVIDEVLDSYFRGWPSCGKRALDVMVNSSEAWPRGSTASSVGDIGAACILDGAPPSSLVRVVIVSVIATGLQETFVNNVQMRLAAASAQPAEFFVLLQDDQFMTVPGWNIWLAHPARTFSDVFSVTMRCVHSWPSENDYVGARCQDLFGIAGPRAMEDGAPPGHWRFSVRDSGNRGPLLLRGSRVRELGFLDEVHFAGHWTPAGGDDHELNKRAYGYGAHPTRRWVAGHLAIPFTEERCCRTRSTKEADEAGALAKAWWEARRCRIPRLSNPGPSGFHNEYRFLEALPLSP